MSLTPETLEKGPISLNFICDVSDESGRPLDRVLWRSVVFYDMMTTGSNPLDSASGYMPILELGGTVQLERVHLLVVP